MIVEAGFSLSKKIHLFNLSDIFFRVKVINEMARVSSHGPGIFRKTLKDVHVNGICLLLHA